MEEQEKPSYGADPWSSIRGVTVTQRYLDISTTIFKETLHAPFLLEEERGKACFRDPYLKNNIHSPGSLCYSYGGSPGCRRQYRGCCVHPLPSTQQSQSDHNSKYNSAPRISFSFLCFLKTKQENESTGAAASQQIQLSWASGQG